MADLDSDQRQSGAGNPFTSVPVRRPVRPAPRWKRILKTGFHGITAAILLAAGTFWTLNQQRPKFLKPGGLLQLPAAVVTAQPPGTEGYALPADSAKREEILESGTRFSSTPATRFARKGSRQQWSRRRKRNLHPALLIGVLLTEDVTLNPPGKELRGARGLMQVMPFHAGKWKQCPSSDLFAIEINVCYGTSIRLISSSGRHRWRGAPALQWVREGTNTPHCHTYSGRCSSSPNRQRPVC